MDGALPDRRVNLTRPTVPVVTSDRSPRRLRAVRWTHVTEPWREPVPRSIIEVGRRP